MQLIGVFGKEWLKLRVGYSDQERVSWIDH